MKNLEEILEALARAKTGIGRIVLGQERAIDLCLSVIICRRHALLEGVPGIAKTLLVRAMAKMLGRDFGRIQFTPDLMPSDITGASVFDLQSNQFRLLPGPVFASFLLADEINRAPAKTQSALLQAMQERRVTIDRDTHALPPDFTVFATQNPAEYEGTYPLPEAQKDRFMFKIKMDYPTAAEELQLAASALTGDSPETRLETEEHAAALGEEILDNIHAAVGQITVRPELVSYAVSLVRATRETDSVLLGAGPRATEALVLGARAFAAVSGSDFVTPDHIREIAAAALAHRLVLRPEHEVEGLVAEEVVAALLAKIPVPR
jgi:MoxR-like ATPases